MIHRTWQQRNRHGSLATWPVAVAWITTISRYMQLKNTGFFRFDPILAAIAVTISWSNDSLARTWSPHVFSGDCAIDEEPKWPVLCIKPMAEASYLVDTSNGTGRYSLLGAEVYAGFYWSEHLSLHLNDDYGILRSLPAGIDEKNKHLRQEYYLAVGNTATSKPRALLGRFDLPFGLGNRFRPQVFDLLFGINRFSDTYGEGLQLTYDNLVNARIDIAVARDENLGREVFSERSSNQYSMRAFYDFAALNGTRLAASYFRHEASGVSKVGGAAFNQVENVGETYLEWVRISRDWRRPFSSDEQMIAVGYRQAMTDAGRAVCHYEFLQGIHRMFDLGYEYSVTDFDVLSAFLSLERKHDPDARNLNAILTASLKVRI